jgi:hypothetical protein
LPKGGKIEDIVTEKMYDVPKIEERYRNDISFGEFI